LRDKTKLALVRGVHTIIYIILAASVFLILYSGIVGYKGYYLYISLVLVTIEAVVFFAFGMKCPLTSLAKKYGAEKGYVFDTFLPEKMTRYTFRFFGTVLVIGIILLIIRIIFLQ